MRLRELARYAFQFPNLTTSFFRVSRKILVSVRKISVDRCLCRCERCVVAVVNNCPRHSAKYGFNHVKKLRTGRQRCGFYDRESISGSELIQAVKMGEELFRNMPRSCIPGEIDRAAISI